MLTAVATSHDQWFSEWRALELARVARAGVTYLDYGGAALYPASLLRGDMARLEASVLGNPHSGHQASRDATDDVEAARTAVLRFLDADPREYTVVFTANASAGCRLVGEGYRFDAGTPLVLTADNHNSVNGIREFARRRGGATTTVSLDHELRLQQPVETLARAALGYGGLFAFPAQSNFSGVRHPLELVDVAQELGYRVLLDAAAYLPSMPLDLQRVHPDYVVLSIYKIAGYPTGVGALVARHDALAALERPWFSGGTVDWVSVQSEARQLRQGAAAFEDGTVPFLSLGAVPAALALVHELQPRLRPQLGALTRFLLQALGGLRHHDGTPMVAIHGPATTDHRGATVAFSVLTASGEVVPFWDIEREASEAGLAVRGGCFCNPGCAERALMLPANAAKQFAEVPGGFTHAKAAAALGGKAVGAVRVSLGLGSVQRDVERLLEFIAVRSRR